MWSLLWLDESRNRPALEVREEKGARCYGLNVEEVGGRKMTFNVNAGRKGTTTSFKVEESSYTEHGKGGRPKEKMSVHQMSSTERTLN